MSLPEYRHLDWRIDVELATRSIAHEATPRFMLRLDLTEDSDRARSIHFRSDHANIKNLLAQLEAAVDEERTAHARRFQRYIR